MKQLEELMRNLNKDASKVANNRSEAFGIYVRGSISRAANNY